MSDNCISIQNLRITAGGRIILLLEELAVQHNEVFAVLGPNGAGKSTFLKTLVGLQHSSAGNVRVLGMAVGKLRGNGLCRLRRRIGYVPQMLVNHGEMPLTLREVVAIGRTGIAGVGRRLGSDHWRIIDDWIDRLGLSALASRRYTDCSGGEQRKALIAKAMVQNPELLLLDEPTANLDLSWRERMVATIEQVYDQTHVTVVLVCHELEIIPPCCRRLMILEAGRMTALGSAESILTNERIKKLYGDKLNVIHDKGRYAAVPILTDRT